MHGYPSYVTSRYSPWKGTIFIIFMPKVEWTCQTKVFQVIDQDVDFFNKIAGFFDHQYLRKKTINVLDFLHRASYKGKIATTTINWMGPDVPSCVQSYLNLSGGDLGWSGGGMATYK